MGVDVVVSAECQVAVVSVAGEVATTAQAHEVADRILEVAPSEGPVIVDLSRVQVEPDELAWLVLRFEAAPHWHRFRLVDDRLDHRRHLRELCRRVPVLPDVATALSGARSEVPAGTPILDIVDLWGGSRHPTVHLPSPSPPPAASTSGSGSGPGHPTRLRAPRPSE